MNAGWNSSAWLLCLWRRRHFELSFQQYYYMGVGAAEAGRPLAGCIARLHPARKPDEIEQFT